LPPAPDRAFAEWILLNKRKRRASGLYVVGVHGSIGQGKTVFSQAVARHLKSLLTPEEGQALSCSIDDYYLPRAERYRPDFLARGYAPEEIPNRGPAGTHDTALLRRHLETMEQAGGGVLQIPRFDKQSDDRFPDPLRVRGKVGVFILEGWFVGAKTDVDPAKAEPGLKRSVAAALIDYKPVFDRLDALWAFEPPPTLEDIVAQRIEQQETTDRETGRTGMTPDQIRRFVQYFYRDSWQEGVTSPVPPKAAAAFWAVADSRHRIVRIIPSL